MIAFPTTIEETDALIAKLQSHRMMLVLNLEASVKPTKKRPVVLVRHSEDRAQEHALDWPTARARAEQLRVAGFKVYCVESHPLSATGRLVVLNIERKAHVLNARALDVDGDALLPHFQKGA